MTEEKVEKVENVKTLDLKAAIQMPPLEPLGRHIFVDSQVPVYNETGEQIGYANAYWENSLCVINTKIYIDYATPERLLIQEGEKYWVYPVWKSHEGNESGQDRPVFVDEVTSLTLMGKSMGVLVKAERVVEDAEE